MLALGRATAGDTHMRQSPAALIERINTEDGVAAAVRLIEGLQPA